MRLLPSLATLLLSMAVLASCSTAGHDSAANGSPGPSRTELARLDKKLAKKKAAPKRYDKPQEAADFFVAKRAADGEQALPIERYLTAKKRADALPRFSIASGERLPSLVELRTRRESQTSLGNWTALGPGNIGGRTRALVIDPANPSIMFAAGVAGGVWKSVDAGASWTPLTDLLPNLAVCSLAMAPMDSQTLYAGTGEGFFNWDRQRGAGVFKTSDGGATWLRLEATAGSSFYYVNDIQVSANAPDTLYLATGDGVWRSRDAGASFAKVLAANVVGGCLELTLRDDRAPDSLLASCGTFAQATVYRSQDGGDTWQAVLTDPAMGRTSLALAPSNQDVAYAMASSIAAGDLQHGLLGVYRSTDGGATWSPRVVASGQNGLSALLLSNPVYANYAQCWGGDANYFYNQGWYDNVLGVDPANPDIVWAGGVDLMRSDDGGQSWRLGSCWWCDGDDPVYNHADQHAIVFHPDYDGVDNRTMFTGNDGGISRTDDARAITTDNVCNPSAEAAMAWTSLNNGYGVTQFYHGLPYPGGAAYFGGTQDNGTLRGSVATGKNAWSRILDGDGGYVAVDPRDTNVVYAETIYISIEKSTDGGASFTPATDGVNDPNALFITPFVLDPNAPDILWTGGGALWRSTNGAQSWQQASADTGGRISALAVAPGDSNTVAAGQSGGSILLSRAALQTDAGSAWTKTKVVQGYISSVAFAPNSPTTLYATCSTFGVPHVWRPTDSGSTWTSLDGSGADALPDIPAHVLVVDPRDPNRLIVGTDLGVFVSATGGGSWMVENSGFANVVTEQLALDTASGSLFAFTHGRGVYRASLWDVGAGRSPATPLLLLGE